MLQVNQLIGFGAGGSPKSMLDIIRAVGLSSGLTYVFDAGDINSYSGSGSTWTDVSGNGNNFTKQSTVNFTGTAGALDETNYFSFNGISNFTGTSTTYDDHWCWIGGAVTHVVVCYPISATDHILGGNLTTNAGNGGFRWYIDPSSHLVFNHNLGSSGSASTSTGTTAVTLSALQMVAMSWDDSTVIFQVNSTQETPSSFGAFASTQLPPKDWLFGNDGLGNHFANNDRAYATACWNAALTTTQLSALYTALKSNRFPSLP